MIKLDKEKVRALFENGTFNHQADILIAIYKMVYPDYGYIEKIDGWPTINQNTWRIISKWFQEFDLKHHPRVLRGGLWMNNGFSGHGGEALADWEVDETTATITYRGERIK